MTSSNDPGPASVRDAFASDHEHLDHAFEAFRVLKRSNFTRATIALRSFGRDLRHHMRCEEKVLFSAIELRLGSSGGPTAVMHAEHRRILDTLDRLETKIEAGETDCEEEEAALIELLETHNFKEDQVINPMVDRILDAEARRRLLEDLEQVPVEGNPRCCA